MNGRPVDAGRKILALVLSDNSRQMRDVAVSMGKDWSCGSLLCLLSLFVGLGRVRGMTCQIFPSICTAGCGAATMMGEVAHVSVGRRKARVRTLGVRMSKSS